MDLRYVVLLVIASVTWISYVLGQLTIVSAIGVSTFLWMVFAASCATNTRSKDKQEGSVILSERDIL